MSRISPYPSLRVSFQRTDGGDSVDISIQMPHESLHQTFIRRCIEQPSFRRAISNALYAEIRKHCDDDSFMLGDPEWETLHKAHENGKTLFDHERGIWIIDSKETAEVGPPPKFR